MAHDITALERAFQLASSGGCASVKVIRQRLKAEGYSTGQITGRTLYRQLVALIKATQKEKTQKEKPCAQGTVL